MLHIKWNDIQGTLLNTTRYPKEQFLLFSTIFCCLLVDLCVTTGTRFSLRDKWLFEISEFEITRVDCMYSIETCHTASNEDVTLRQKV